MFVTNSLSGGGAERAMNLASNELVRRGWEVSLVPINESQHDLIEPISEVFPLHRQHRSGLFKTLLTYVKFNLLVRSWKPNVLILVCDLPEFFGALMLPKKQLVIVEEASYPWATRKNFGKAIRKVLNFRGAKTVAASSHLRIWPGRELPNAVIQNALSPYKNKNTSPRRNIHLNSINYIGRLSPEKRPDWFIEICRLGNFKGNLVGNGEMSDMLSSWVNKENISVKLNGFLKDPWNMLKEGDILVVPSVSEGDGLVVIEAIQQGVPLLLSDIPDFRRFCFPEVHYCASTTDFVSRIMEYQNNLEHLIVSSEYSTSILRPRNLDVVGKSWEDFLNSLN